MGWMPNSHKLSPVLKELQGLQSVYLYQRLANHLNVHPKLILSTFWSIFFVIVTVLGLFSVPPQCNLIKVLLVMILVLVSLCSPEQSPTSSSPHKFLFTMRKIAGAAWKLCRVCVSIPPRKTCDFVLRSAPPPPRLGCNNRALNLSCMIKAAPWASTMCFHGPWRNEMVHLASLLKLTYLLHQIPFRQHQASSALASSVLWDQCTLSSLCSPLWGRVVPKRCQGMNL